MPIPDLGPTRSSIEQLGIAQERAAVRRLARLKQIRAVVSRRSAKRPRPGGGEAGEAVAVEPDRPLDLSGGAAAALEFDD